MLRRLADGNLLLLVLVPYLAHQLFEDILQRDQANRPAEFIQYDRDMQFLFLKLLHQLIDLLVCCRKQCRTHHFPDAQLPISGTAPLFFFCPCVDN